MVQLIRGIAGQATPLVLNATIRTARTGAAPVDQSTSLTV